MARMTTAPMMTVRATKAARTTLPTQATVLLIPAMTSTAEGDPSDGGSDNGGQAGEDPSGEPEGKDETKTQSAMSSGEFSPNDDERSERAGVSARHRERSRKPVEVPARMVPLPASTFSNSDLAPDRSPRPRTRRR